jgi:hypothetical protein
VIRSLQVKVRVKVDIIIQNIKELFKYVKGMATRGDDEQFSSEEKFLE